MLIAKKFGLILLNLELKPYPVNTLHGKVGSTQSMSIAHQSTLTEPGKRMGCMTAEWMTFS